MRKCRFVDAEPGEDRSGGLVARAALEGGERPQCQPSLVFRMRFFGDLERAL